MRSVTRSLGLLVRQLFPLSRCAESCALSLAVRYRCRTHMLLRSSLRSHTTDVVAVTAMASSNLILLAMICGCATSGSEKRSKGAKDRQQRENHVAIMCDDRTRQQRLTRPGRLSLCIAEPCIVDQAKERQPKESQCPLGRLAESSHIDCTRSSL